MGKTEFVRLDSVLDNGRIATRLRITNYGGKSTTYTEEQKASFMPQLMTCDGEFDGYHWAASSETCKRLGRQTILVRVEDQP